MLHYKTIDSTTLELLKKLQKLPVLSDMRLVGGTSLALQLDHRKSIDLDLFGILKGDELVLSQSLRDIAPLQLLKNTENIHIYLIEGIKVDIVNYHYKWLDEPLYENELVLAGKKDIAAMKLSAISGRGSKKDFIDIYFLLKEYSLKEMLGFYLKKYYDGSEFMVIKSLTYFDDADVEVEPTMLKPANWGKIKTSILNEVERYVNDDY
jgi:hypothetical protein